MGSVYINDLWCRQCKVNGRICETDVEIMYLTFLPTQGIWMCSGGGYVPLSGNSTAVADCVHMLQQQHPEVGYMNQCKLDITIPGIKQNVKGQTRPTFYPLGHDCPKCILLYLRRKPTVFRNISCCSVYINIYFFFID